jgi:basic amino acid/polyamine antiporter, APA family
MPLVRSIGKWGLTGLMVNAMIGSFIFGVPGELIKLLGGAAKSSRVPVGAWRWSSSSPALLKSRRNSAEAGGPYVYARVAFGRLAGLQVAWFAALAPMAAAAAQANLFVNCRSCE